MLNYLLEVSLCWLGFYLLYAFWLSKETFFETNRWYLIVSLLLGLIIPFTEMPMQVTSEEAEWSYLEMATITVQQAEAQIATVVATPISSAFSLQEILLCIYGLGFLLMTIRFSIGLVQIYTCYKNSRIEKKTSYLLLHNEEVTLPFSFFHALFINTSANYTASELDSIVRHELVHIKGKHSVDVLLLEILNIVFWCSPLIYCYRRSLRNVHEYLADANVLKTTTKRQYGQLLLQQFQKGSSIAIANNFIHSQLKKRIQMMTKNQSTNTARWKYLLVAPVFLCLLFVLSKTDLMAQTNSSLSEEKPVAKEERVHPVFKEIQNDPIYKVVDEMPRFPGCEEMEEREKRTKCSQTKMLEFVYRNIKYPAAARKGGVEGTTVIRFVVSKEGKVVKPEMIRTIGGGCDEEVLRVIENMPMWIPGKRNGKHVAVYYNLPVKFKLEGSESTTNENTETKEEKNIATVVAVEETSIIPNDVFTIVEEMPRFPGCEDIEDMDEQTTCAREQLLQFVYKNVKYPKTAQDAGAEGVVVVRFIIDENGNINDSEIIRSLGHGLDEAVLTIIDEMVDQEKIWTPGKQRGKKVKVAFNLPVRFKLDPSKKAADKSESRIENTLELQSFSITPNPTLSEVQLSFEIADTKDLTLQLTDINGRTIAMPTPNFTNGKNDLTLDLSKAATGIIFITLQKEDKIFTKQLVKQ